METPAHGVLHPLPENLYPEFSRPELRMRSLVAVCDAQLVTLEEQRRHQLAVLRRRARYERYRNKCNRKIQTCDADLAVKVSYDGSRLEVRVQNPLTHFPEDGGRFTTYEIAIHTNNIAFTLPKSYVRRRYSDFQWIRKHLTSEHPDIKPPELPPRTWWGGQFEPAVIEERLRGLKTFMEGVLLQRVYLSNKALHLFVQSQLDPREIDYVLSGRDKTSVTEHILEASRLCSSRARCWGCREEGEEDDTSSTCSSNSDLKLLDDVCALPSDIRAGTDDLRDLDNSTSDLERSELTSEVTSDASGDSKIPLMSSTPQRSWSDSALVLHDIPDDELNTSSDTESTESTTSSKDDSVTDIPDSAAAMAAAASAAAKRHQRKIRPVLSQSLPTATSMQIKCGHRKRRVTFNNEVTVAKVLETPDKETTDKQGVSLVEVHSNKGKTKEQ